MPKSNTVTNKVNRILEAAREYEDRGWVLIPIDPATKRPLKRGWQLPQNQGAIPEDWKGNIGIAHVASLTCAIDIDDLRRARNWLLLTHDINIDELLDAEDAVQIVSGRDNKAKLLYRLDEPLLRVSHSEDGQAVLDFRCMSSKGTTFQDVLPPSVHPDTGAPYEWGGRGDWRNLPPLPEELRTVWLSLIERRGSRDAGEDAQASPSTGRTGGEEWGEEVWREALSHIDPNCNYDRWIAVGMAIHAKGLDFEVWDDWSSGGDSYPGSEALRSHWSSFEAGGGVSGGTLYHIAVESGWEPPRGTRLTPEEMFPDDAGLDDTIQRASEPTLVSVRAEIDALSPGDDISNLLRRLAMVDKIRGSETVAKLHCDDIAARIAVSRSAVWADYRSIRRQYHRLAAENRRSQANVPVDRRLEIALNTLASPLRAPAESEKDVLARFIFMGGGPFEGKFFDRVTRSWLSPSAFNLLHSPLTANLGDGEGGTVSPAAYFVPRMITCGTMEYWPGNPDPLVRGDHGSFILNAWRDSGKKPGPGDPTRWLDHLAWLLPNVRERRQLLQWLAFLVRHQDLKINYQVILGGASRIGKDTLLQPVLAAIGPGNYSLVRPEQLGEPYHDWALNTKLAVFNELMGSGLGHAKLENLLKPFAAAPPHELSLRLFGKSARHTQPNLIQILATTNHRDAFNFTDSRERWFALWCAPEQRQANGYYDHLHHWLEHQGGEGAVIRYLHGVNLADFDPKGCAPVTKWQRQLVLQGEEADVVSSVLRELLENESSPFDKPTFKLADVVEALHIQLMGDPGERKRITRPRVIAALHALGCGYSGELKTTSENGTRARMARWCLPEVQRSFSDPATAEDWERYL